MNLKAKTYVQDQKLAAEQKLSARLAILKERGIDETGTIKDPLIKKLKADIRKSNQRLRSIAVQEKLITDKVQAKADKAAAKKQAKETKTEGAKKPAAKAPAKEKKAKKSKEK